MILKSYIFSLISDSYQQYTSDHTETFLKYYCKNCQDEHQITIHRDGNLMYYSYLFKSGNSETYGLCSTCGEVCLNLQWLLEFYKKTIEEASAKGILFSFDNSGRIHKQASSFSSEAAEADNLFRYIKEYLESQPQYWEKLPPEDLSVPLDSSIRFSLKEDQSKEIIEATRHYHNIVITSENTVPSSFSETVRRLNSEKSQLAEKKNALESEINILKRQKKQYKLVILLSMMLAVGILAIIIFTQNVNELQDTVQDKEQAITSLNSDISNFQSLVDKRDSKIKSLNNQISSKNKKINEQEQLIWEKDSILNQRDYELAMAISELNDLKKTSATAKDIPQNMQLFVSDISLRSGEGKYGGPIYSSNTSYIYTRLEIIGLKTGTVDLYVKFFAPYGLSTGKDSPSGYSYKSTVKIKKAEQSTVYIDGWGRAEKGLWESGKYRIEIWNNGICLIEKTFTVY